MEQARVSWGEIPESIRAVFGELWNEVAVLHGKWNVSRELVRSPEALDILNGTAPVFFALVQESLWHDMANTISRLLDPARDGPKRENLSLQRLVDGLEGCDSRQVEGARDHLQDARDHCKDILLLRNKQVAHADFHATFHSQVIPLPELSEGYMLKTLNLIANVLRWVQVCYMDETTDFNSPEPGRSVVAMIALLEAGQERIAMPHQDE